MSHARRERRSSTNDPDASWQARQERSMGGKPISWGELRRRGFVGVADTSPRCWCGRPQSQATGACKLGHERPRA